jgi:hypothetical protein
VTFSLTEKQQEARGLIGSDARHIMLLGGARSGKTFLLVRSVLIRALSCPSRHAILRYRFNAVKQSVIYDTLPKVINTCWPGLWEKCKLDKSDWFLTVPCQGGGKSEIWFGGLDDKERTEKILGQEYATIYFNECSQIPWPSRNIAMTRLAQKTDLRLKALYDCNPPSEAHWTYKMFVLKQDPDRRSRLPDPDNYAWMQLNPADNIANLPPEYIPDVLEKMSERDRRRFLLGQFASVSENALWSLELIDRGRVLDGALPDMQRIVIAVDPSGSSGDEDKRSDEVGIIAAGLGVDGKAYVLEDLSGRFAPAQWGKIVTTAYDRLEADVVVAETNYGGAMVAEVIRAARDKQALRIPFREVKASRGKSVRAEPVSALYEQGKIVHAGFFEVLEDQLCGMTTAGWMGSRSPDRADALVWAMTELFPGLTRRETKSKAMPVVNLGYQRGKKKWA